MWVSVHEGPTVDAKTCRLTQRNRKGHAFFYIIIVVVVVVMIFFFIIIAVIIVLLLLINVHGNNCKLPRVHLVGQPARKSESIQQPPPPDHIRCLLDGRPP